MSGLLLVILFAQEVPRPPAGWRIELVAEAPKIQHPTVVACAPDGRVFVGEDPMDMKPPARKKEGRVLCLHPDGKITVFADRLYAPFGLLYLEGKLYVNHGPHLSVYADGGGAGKDRADLIACTTPEPWALDWNDHIPANLRPAMDGYLYMSFGDKGIYGAAGRDGSKAECRGGGVLRFRPDGTGLEIFSSGTRNHLDVAIDAEDEVFTYDNTDEHHWMGRLTHMVDGGTYGYPWDFHPRKPYTLWMFADFGGGAATGALAYNEDALPEEFRGNLFLADFGKRNVLRVRVARDGATYKVVSREDLFSNTDSFWPVGLAVSPDGMSLYVTDWVIYERKNVTVGRLFKVTHPGPSRAAPPPAWYLPAAMGRPVEVSVDDLMRGLSHRALGVRLTAQRRLAERRAEAPLARLLQDRSAPAAARRHALWALGGQGAIEALGDPDPSLRRQAARLLGTRRSGEAGAALILRLKDSDPAVRFHAATALGRIGDPAAVGPLLGALEEKDSFARYAAFTALARIGRADPKAWDLIARGLECPAAAVREGTIFALRETYSERVVAGLAQAVRNSGTPAETRAAAVEALASLYRKEPPWDGKWWNGYPGVSPYHPALSPRPARTVDWEGTPLVLETLRKALGDADARVRGSAVEGLGQARDRDSAALLRALFAREGDLAVRVAILRSLSIFKDAGSKDLLEGVLADAAAAKELLLEALAAAESLGGDAGRELVLGYLASPRGGPEPLFRALTAVAKLGGDRAADEVLRFLESPDLEVRRAALGALGKLRSRKAVPALLAAFAREETKFEAALALTRMPDLRALDAYLYALGSANTDLRWGSASAMKGLGKNGLAAVERRLDAIPGPVVAELQLIFASAKESPLHRVKPKKVTPEEYQDFALKNGGDAGRGRRVFHDLKGVACVKCHRVRGEGGDLGPDLSSIGAQYKRADLVESVLFPSRKVREGYQQVIVLTKDGRVVSGAVKAETPEEVALQDAEGARHVIRKAEIEQRKASELSLMPEALNAGLSLEEFADLVNYLESLKDGPPGK